MTWPTKTRLFLHMPPNRKVQTEPAVARFSPPIVLFQKLAFCPQQCAQRRFFHRHHHRDSSLSWRHERTSKLPGLRRRPRPDWTSPRSTYQHGCDGEGHGAEEQPHPAGRDVTLLFTTCHASHFSKPMSNFTSFILRRRLTSAPSAPALQT